MLVGEVESIEVPPSMIGGVFEDLAPSVEEVVVTGVGAKRKQAPSVGDVSGTPLGGNVR